jgi:tetratricopeptide (TPR) repeat protein
LAGADATLVEVIEVARAKVQREPHSAAAWGLLGQILYAHHYFEDAAFCLAWAEHFDPHDPRWRYLWGLGLVPRDLHAAIPHLRRSVELLDGNDDYSVAARLRLAEALLSLGRFDEAEPLLRRVQEQTPHDARVHYGLGILAFGRQDWPTSRQHLQRCLNSPYARQKACSQLATVCQRLDDAESAAEFMRRGNRLDKDLDWDDPFERDNFRLVVGKQDRFFYAEKMLRDDQYAAEGIAVLRELVEQYSDDYRLYIALAKALGKRGQTPEAERLLRRAIALAPQRAQAHYFLCLSLFQQASEQWRQGHKPESGVLFEQAADAARKAIDCKPDHALAHAYLGLSLWGLDRKTEAIAALRAAVDCGPDAAEPYLFLGQALAEDGRPTEARPYLEQALRLAPDDPRARTALDQLKEAKEKQQRKVKEKDKG